MDFQNLDGVWKQKRFGTTCMELIFVFCLGEFFFSLNFSTILTFRCMKPILKLKLHVRNFVYWFNLISL